MAEQRGLETSPKFTLSSWAMLEAREAQDYLDQEILRTDRLTVLRCVYRPGYDVAAHYHPQEQITIVEEGVLELTIEGQVVQVRAGEMISIPPRVRHATRVAGSARARALNLFVLPEGTSAGCGPADGSPRMYR